MSVKIGIVCEGISDYRILQHITERYLRDQDVYTIPLKPKETKQGAQDGFGSWQGVLEYIKGDDQMIVEAVKEGCRYIIVHIDTDVREQYGVSVDFTSQEELYESVKAMLLRHLHPEFDSDMLIFAIAIHETECWLIPFISEERKECAKTDSCVNTVNRLLKGKGSIDKDNKNAEKVRPIYQNILKQKKKAKDIKAASRYNYGFACFIDTLDRIKAHL